MFPSTRTVHIHCANTYMIKVVVMIVITLLHITNGSPIISDSPVHLVDIIGGDDGPRKEWYHNVVQGQAPQLGRKWHLWLTDWVTG